MPKKDLPITRASCSVPKLYSLDRQGNVIAPSTGMFYRSQDRIYLITNWHVISGYNPQTMRTLNREGRETWSLRIEGRQSTDGRLSCPFDATVKTRDEGGNPIWLEHPTLGKNVDTAAIEITSHIPAQIHCINDDIVHREYIIQPGDSLFILGYPMGLSGGRRLPIWKNSSIASEPFFTLDGQKKFMVDASTTMGMSGSPVIFRSSSYMVPTDEFGTEQHGYSIGKTIQEFIGVYSGRIAALDEELKNDPLAAQIGYVWQRTLVEELLMDQ